MMNPITQTNIKINQSYYWLLPMVLEYYRINNSNYELNPFKSSSRGKPKLINTYIDIRFNHLASVIKEKKYDNKGFYLHLSQSLPSDSIFSSSKYVHEIRLPNNNGILVKYSIPERIFKAFCENDIPSLDHEVLQLYLDFQRHSTICLLDYKKLLFPDETELQDLKDELGIDDLTNLINPYALNTETFLI